jgi:hypothetical protein
MSQKQLDTAEKMTRLRPVQRQRKKPPAARHSSIALTATPAPAMGPEDELLFDPDEEQYGNAGPGAGYVAEGTNVPLGVQTYGKNSPTTPPKKKEKTPRRTNPPVIIDLKDPEPSKPPSSFFGGSVFWIVLVLGLVSCSLCFLFVARGQTEAAPPPPPPMMDYGLGGGLSGLT